MSDDLDENPRAFLDVCIGDDGPTRRITIRLFHEDTPKAVDKSVSLLFFPAAAAAVFSGVAN